MKNLGQKILLQVFCHPAWTSFIIAVVLVPLSVFFFVTEVGTDTPVKEGLLILIIVLGFFGIWAGLGFALYSNSEKYVTYTTTTDESIILLRVSSEGKVIETGTAMWGTERIYKIKKPYCWQHYPRQKDRILVETNIISENLFGRTIIPVEIDIRLNGDFDWQEIYDKVIKSMNEENIDEFVRKTLLASAKTNQKEVDNLTQQHAERKISDIVLLNKVGELIDIPRNLFKNCRRDTEPGILLKEPTVKVCKGVSCET